MASLISVPQSMSKGGRLDTSATLLNHQSLHPSGAKSGMKLRSMHHDGLRCFVM